MAETFGRFELAEITGRWLVLVDQLSGPLDRRLHECEVCDAYRALRREIPEVMERVRAALSHPPAHRREGGAPPPQRRRRRA